MNQKIVKTLVVLFLIVLSSSATANDISVRHITLTGENTTDKYVMVQFDLGWKNAWNFSNGPSNRDAAWVFVKYRITVANGGDGVWKHANLNVSGHTGGTGTSDSIFPGLLTPGSAFDASTNPALGVFISRKDFGSGDFSATGVKLRWNYGSNSVADNAVLDIRVFAIEMVYVPEGSFYVGSGSTESGSFTNGSWTSGATIPLQITSENALTIGQTAGNLWGRSSSGTNTIGGAGTLAATFPKGYGAFYCMKYEISQQQYVDFLNTLTSTQAANRFSASSTGNRYSITVSSGVYSTTNPYVACNFLNWPDGAAYTDWAGLRPMTEMEYEKACRGTLTPVAGEYAWGNTTATAANNITNNGAGNETTTTTGANIVVGNQANVQGPMRVGVFATSATTRAQAGSTYYGIMEMSGNLYEQAVTVGNTDGRAFTGRHGNGQLSTNGHADVTAWPGLASGEVTGASGSGFRGGDWSNSLIYCCISDRYNGVMALMTRMPYISFRAVRSFPFQCSLMSFTVNHTTADGVAPVDETVTYGTATNIPGETSKCWITKNLGADIQADSVNAKADTKAGWYWQFNRKTGYRYNAATVTPSWSVTSISENSDWLSTNDPCMLELGTGWRLPTGTEWNNVDGGGNWSNYNGHWNSPLKLHAAGYLSSSSGSLTSRGAGGYYWSSMQNNLSYSWGLNFNSGNSYTFYYPKAHGFSVRCIRE